jgi:hypothetical protein
MLNAVSKAEYCASLLRAATHAAVAAKFERSFYLRLAEQRFVCIGEETIGEGALNILISSRQWSSCARVAVGGAVRIDGDTLQLGAELTIALHGARLWSPDRPRLDLQRERPAPPMAEFARCAAVMAPAEGLSALALPSACADHQLLAAARPAWGRLHEWLSRVLLDAKSVMPEPPQEVESLIGLGPGLTPSGDDLLCGVLVALHAFGQARVADTLWRRIAPLLTARTSSISAAHCTAAAAGQAHAAIHEVLRCVLQEPAMLGAALAGLNALGHSSGWDACAGLLLVLRCLNRYELNRRMASSAA